MSLFITKNDINVKLILLTALSQATFTCSQLTMETPEQCVKSVQS